MKEASTGRIDLGLIGLFLADKINIASLRASGYPLPAQLKTFKRS
jgi:hypothetical protein